MKTLTMFAPLLVCAVAMAAPTPYPVTINSQSKTMPDLIAYRASETAFALTLVDGSAKMDLTGHSVWMAWSTNANSTSASTARVDIVSATNGTATATFSPASVNYTPGRYFYEVGVSTGDTVRTVRHGVFLIYGSPYATGADPVTWTTNWNLGLITLTGTIPMINLPITTNSASTSDVLIPTAGALSRAIAAAGVAYDDSWTNALGSLAWKSTISSNDVDAETDAAYRGGGETLWPASSNDVLTHVASHHVLEGGGFVAGPVKAGGINAGIAIGPSADNDGTDGVAIGKGATTADGVAIGALAATWNDALGEPLEAIQLGQGTNTTVRSFQVYDYQVLDGSGYLALARLQNITSNQMATATDEAYRNSAATGITSNQMDTATDAAYRSATTETKSYWSMSMSGDQNNILGTNYNVMAFDTVVASGGASTIYTNTYSAKFGTTGVFYLGMRVRHSGMDTGKSIRSQFLITGNAQPEEGRDVNASSSDSLTMLFQWNAIVAITNADATVQVTFYTGDTENDVDLGGYGSAFFGVKVSDL